MRIPVSNIQALWAIVTIALLTDSARGVEPLKPANRPAAENPSGKYAEVNGLRIYYEVHGAGGIPLVLLHGGGSSINTTFGNVLPRLAKTRQVIALEERGHGRTADIVDRPFRFEDSADDVAALLRHLKIERADFFGFSNGGNIALQIAIRHPALVNKLVVGSTMSKRDGIYPEVWEFIKRSSPKDMPKALQEEYLRLAPNPGQLSTFHDKCVERVLSFKDWPAADLRAIQAPTLVIIGDSDSIRPEHAVEMFRTLPHAQLAVLPGGHGAYIGEVTAARHEDSQVKFGESDASTQKMDRRLNLTVNLLEEFLESTTP